MSTVRQILRTKGSDVWSVAPQTSVYDALKKLAEKDIGALVVMEGARVLGLFSERDYARKVVLQGRSSQHLTVAEIMTQPVLYVSLEQTIEECMALMTAKRVRHLPVLEGGCLAGLISIGDVVKAMIEDQAFTIQQLEHYITGSDYGALGESPRGEL